MSARVLSSRAMRSNLLESREVPMEPRGRRLSGGLKGSVCWIVAKKPKGCEVEELRVYGSGWRV